MAFVVQMTDAECPLGKQITGSRGRSRARHDLTFAGIECSPFLGKQFQVELGFALSTGRIDGFELGCHCFHVLVRHVTQRVPDQMHHAQLHARLRIDRLNLLAASRSAHPHKQERYLSRRGFAAR